MVSRVEGLFNFEKRTHLSFRGKLKNEENFLAMRRGALDKKGGGRNSAR